MCAHTLECVTHDLWSLVWRVEKRKSIRQIIRKVRKVKKKNKYIHLVIQLFNCCYEAVFMLSVLREKNDCNFALFHPLYFTYGANIYLLLFRVTVTLQQKKKKSTKYRSQECKQEKRY